MPCVPWHRGAQQIHNQTAPHTGDILLASLFHLDGHLSLPRSQSAIERGHSKNIFKIDSSEHLLLFPWQLFPKAITLNSSENFISEI